MKKKASKEEILVSLFAVLNTICVSHLKQIVLVLRYSGHMTANSPVYGDNELGQSPTSSHILNVDVYLLCKVDI